MSVYFFVTIGPVAYTKIVLQLSYDYRCECWLYYNYVVALALALARVINYAPRLVVHIVASLINIYGYRCEWWLYYKCVAVLALAFARVINYAPRLILTADPRGVTYGHKMFIKQATNSQCFLSAFMPTFLSVLCVIDKALNFD